MTPRVDWAARTITGLAVPYGRTARSGGRRIRYLPGWWRTDGPVWLLRDHDNSQRLGRALQLVDVDAGLHAVLSVRPGRAGDRALAQADAGDLGLSVHAELVELIPEHGVRLVVAGLLREISVTENPAFGRW